MRKEDKEILLKNLCGRLPYGVKCKDFEYNTNGNMIDTVEVLETISPLTSQYSYKDIDAEHDIERIKPYLRPMSSMTEEEKSQLSDFLCESVDSSKIGISFPPFEHYGKLVTFDFMSKTLDWLNEHHFDYFGLIEKGLVLKAPEDMY